MCVQCWAAIAAAHTYSNIIPVQRRGACLSRDTHEKNISKYLSVGTDDNSRAEAKGAGSFVGEDNTLIVFQTQRATQHTDGVFRVD